MMSNKNTDQSWWMLSYLSMAQRKRMLSFLNLPRSR
jgi:hypothetical protein